MRISVVALGVVVVALLLYIAGEQHYQSCVVRESATLTATPENVTGPYDDSGWADDQKFADANSASVEPDGDVEGCSRLPF